MVRKAASALLVDVGSFLTGVSILSDYREGNDRWLHPIDCSMMLLAPNKYFGPFDAAGLPMQDFPNIGTVYVPSRTAAFGFAHWNALCLQDANSARHRENFLASARWFAAFPEGKITHDFPLLNLSAGWLSALAQGEALSIFARAYLLTSDPEWHDCARRVADWLSLPVDAGGVRGALPDRSPFLEEYPGTRHKHVLNGCLYALAGLTDAADVGAIDRILAGQVADAVETNLPYWNRRGWSLYQWTSSHAHGANFNTPSYQRVHIALLDHLGQTLGRPAFTAEADRLDRALANPMLRIWALANKMRYRMGQGW